MPEVIIKYKNAKTLQALLDIAKYFDFTVKLKKKQENITSKKEKSLPIDFAKQPDLNALAGTWKDKNITLEELRKKAWGDRL